MFLRIGEESQQHLVLVRGLPGSGKSSIGWLLANFGGFKHFEADQFFTDSFGNYNYKSELIVEAHAWCFAATKKALEDGHNVVVTNNFTRNWEMRPYKSLKTPKILLHVLQAQGNFGSIHNVPFDSILKMLKRFEPNIDE